MKKQQSYAFEISSLTPAGKGLAVLDGVETTIPFALPGQQVQAFVHKKKRGAAEAKLQGVLRPRLDEVRPFCPHFGQPPDEAGKGCGGCSWQQLTYPAQLTLKQQMLERLLAPLLPGLALNPIIPSPQERHYRNKVEFSFGDKLYLSEERYHALREAGEPMPTGFYLGFHVPGSYGTSVDVGECHLISPEALKVYQTLRQLLPDLGGEVYSPRRHTGYWRHLVLRQGIHSGELMVHFNTTDSHSPDWSLALKELNRLDLGEVRIRSVLHSVHTGDAQIVGWNTPTILQGEALIEDELCGLRFEISPYAFFQTNTLAAERLYGEIVRLSHLERQPVVYDLYSGTGSIGMVLARQGAARVYGLEEIATAVADAERNAARNGLSNCRFLAGRVEARLAELLASDRPDLIVLDPPRAGLHPKVPPMLNQLRLPQLLYVSCNPAALARDLSLLLPAYTVSEIQPVDLFPQTGHVETVVRLEARP
ncbi:MAG: 23S rRNA (uracil(1939)-C(5))-methyltransferase RlmD [Candidatus Sericytochromatia bacterium]